MTGTRTDLAVEFLKQWQPKGLWVLTAISTDKKSIDTRTFSSKTKKEAANWIEQYNGERNIYFHVNAALRELTKKADREDIKEVMALHVDIDPRAGEDLDVERKRALGLLTDNLPQGVPPPSCVIFSGGGLQGFWLLEEPIEINGDLERAEDAKRYNLQLELLFGADNCHNIDRIMRLPGTINVPDARKKRKGRKPALAEVVTWTGKRYPLNSFTPTPPVQMDTGGGSFGSGDTVTISGNVERLESIDELDDYNVPDRVKIILVQGRHPDERKEGDDSRSAWLFDAVCQLARCEVPDQMIYSIMTDPEFGISESVLDKGTNAEKYARRQIERAKEEAINPWLRKLNEQFAVIGNLGGRCRVIEEIMDHTLHRPRLTRQSFEDFRNRFMNRKTQAGVTQDGTPIMKPVGKFWLDHPQRRQYDTIVFAPGGEVAGAYNLWKGFACSSRPGDCSLYLGHMFRNICQSDNQLYQYLLHWMARCVQQPATPGEVAVVLRGGRGVGKGFWAKEFCKLFGRHFLHISNSSHLVGNFNSHLRDVVMLFADEAFYAGDRKHESILKTLITEETITIEAKGVDAETAPNFVHLIMASNDRHVVPAGADERRFLVLDVGSEQQQKSGYFKEMAEQLAAGGREALLHILLTLDLEDFQVRDVPSTSALDEQKILSLQPEEEWWYRKLMDGQVLDEDQDWRREVKKRDLVDDYAGHMDRFKINRRGTETSLGRFLKRVCPHIQTVDRMVTENVLEPDGFTVRRRKRSKHYQLPTLADARRRWEELYQLGDWPPDPGDQGSLSETDQDSPF